MQPRATTDSVVALGRVIAVLLDSLTDQNAGLAPREVT